MGQADYGYTNYGSTNRDYGRERFGRNDEDENRFRYSYDDRDLPVDETTRLIASNKVEGTAVYDRDGNRLGSIYNFMVDKRTGRVSYAVLTFGGFLGMGGHYYPLPWQMLTYDTELGGYEVDMDEDDLDNAPSFRMGDEPNFDERYESQVYGYYGVPF